MKEAEMEIIGDFIDRALKISVKIQEASGKNLKDFLAHLAKNEDIVVLGKEVEVILF